MGEVFNSLVDAISGAWWSYPLIFAIAMLDAFFPLVPSETVAITSGVLAGSGDLSLPLCIVCAAGGAFVGDNISYGIGTFLGEKTVKRLFRGEKSRKGFEWAERTLAERGMYLVIVARFIPGGRTATTFAAGYVHSFPWRRFLLADAVAATIWGCYTVLLGYLGGKAFEDAPWKGLLIAFGIAVLITGGVEVARKLRGRRGGRTNVRPDET
jgi:membrane protein DedA with SNARE-associated domain